MTKVTLPISIICLHAESGEVNYYVLRTPKGEVCLPIFSSEERLLQFADMVELGDLSILTLGNPNAVFEFVGNRNVEFCAIDPTSRLDVLAIKVRDLFSAIRSEQN